MKIVGFDGEEKPAFQVSRTPWSRFAVIDADGDPATLELVRWSDRCEGDDLPFLAIHRLHDLAPMLVLTLNPEANKGSRLIFEYEKVEDGSTRVTARRKYEPDRTGRWRFELNGVNRNDVVVEERIGGDFKEVARFVLRDDRSEWRGPGGGSSEFWKRIDEPWVGAGFVRFSELPSDRWFRGGNYGSLRRDADHLKAAREAAREAGLTK